jgi:hypothetical protein
MQLQAEPAPLHNQAARRLWQAALTYPRRWELWIQTAPLLTVIACLLLFAPALYPYRLVMGEIVVFQIMAACISIATLLRQQMDDWRSKLVPNFASGHLFVSGAIVVLLTVGVPLLVHNSLGVCAPGLVSATIVLAAISAWAIYDPAMTFAASLLSGFCFTELGAHEISGFLQGQFVALEWTLIGAGAVGMALLANRLLQLNGEGLVRANLSVDMNFNLPMTGTRSHAFGPFTALLIRLFDWLENRPKPTVALAANIPLRGSNERWRHRQMAMIFKGAPAKSGVIISLLMLAILGVVRIFLPQDADTQTSASILMLAYPLFVVLLIPPIAFPSRWPFLAMESLLPASRPEFIRESAMALAFDVLKFWAGSMVVSIIGILILYPRQILHLQTLHIGWLLLLSAASLPFAFGVGIWEMRLRNGFVSLLATMVTLGGVLYPAEILAVSRHPGVALTAGVALALASVGIALTFDAYRRWCKTELG